MPDFSLALRLFLDVMRLEPPDRVCTCLFCGCDDYRPCLEDTTGDTCSWVVVDRLGGWGVCSACVE